MNKDDIHDEAPSSAQPEQYYRDLSLLSYAIIRVAELNKKKKLTVTRLVKITSNFIQDWQETLDRSTSYKIKIKNKPHLYGMVPYVPYLPDKPCIMDLGPSAKEVKFWKIEKKEGEESSVIILTDITQLKKTLLSEEFAFKEIQIAEADALSQLYSELSTEELNILASHRSLINSKKCIRHLFRKWETNYQEIIKIINENGLSVFNKEHIKPKLLKLIACCTQIEIKTEYTLHKIVDLIGKFELLTNKFESTSTVYTVIMSLIKLIDKKSKLSTGEMAALEEQYKTNRELIYFITRLLIKYFQMKFDNLFIENDLKRINDMKELLERKSIFNSEIKEIKIDPSMNTEQLLQLIQDEHKKAKIRAESLLWMFKDKDKELLPNEDRIDIEINDGRDISNASEVGKNNGRKKIGYKFF